jgi:hypothetical protein
LSGDAEAFAHMSSTNSDVRKYVAHSASCGLTDNQTEWSGAPEHFRYEYISRIYCIYLYLLIIGVEEK